MDDLARDLVRRGHEVWNLEYRRTDGPETGGGWPHTLTDVLKAIRVVVDRSGLATRSLVAVGHSAGGHLGLLAAAHAGLGGVVAQAPITDLALCALEGLGEDATPLFMGGPPESAPTAYLEASPLAHLPIGCPQLVVHGTDDVRVPIEHTRRYVDCARGAGDDVELLEMSGGDHMFVLDPTHTYWSQATSWINAQLASGHRAS